MKTLRPFTFIFFILLFAFTFQSKAQVVVQDIVDRVNNSDYIFEGEAIRSDCYWKDGYGFIYTSLTINITKVFKGDIQCGTVEMITEGGIMGDNSLEISHNLSIGKGDMGIFMCTQTDRQLPLVDFYPENNSVKLEGKYDEQSFIKYFDDAVNKIAVDYQLSFDSLVQVYNLVQFYTQINYVDCYPTRSIFDVHKELHSVSSLDTFPASQRHPSSSVPEIQSTNSSSLDVQFMNRHITSGNPRRFEFDIAFADSLPSAYFGAADVVIDYDTLVFGPNISNGSAIVSLTGIFTNRPYSLQHFDLTYRRFVIRINHLNPVPNGDSLINLSSTPTPAIHVSLEIVDCDYGSFLQMQNLPSYQRFGWCDSAQVHTDTIFSYQNLYFNSTLDFPSCYLHIDAITPLTVSGGINDSITITGLGFDSIRGNGNVFLKNADNGGSSYVPLDSMDYRVWNDSVIVFTVPSIIDSMNLGPRYQFTPGSGQIVVKNNSGISIASTDSVTIFFSVTNAIPNDTGPKAKYFVNLITPPNASAYIFRPDTNFSHHPDRLGCLSKTIRDWVCLTTVNFKLGNDTTISYPDSLPDHINSVRIDTIKHSNAVAKTYRKSLTQRFQCKRAWTYETDIVVNKIYLSTLTADTIPTNPIPVGRHDLYQVLLHEFGHAHSLNHVNDPNAVMWYQESINNNGIPANKRRVKLYNDPSAYFGGSYVINRSLTFDTTWCSSGGAVLVPDLNSNCTPFIGIAEIGKQNVEYYLYPNPASDIVNLSYKLEKLSDVEISIYDVLGRTVYLRAKKNQPAGAFIEKINSQYFTNGFYIVKLSINRLEYTCKFVKQ